MSRLREPVRTDETLDQYARMTNEERTNVKDIGGYVGGEFVGAKRSKDGLLSRSLLVIDADHATGHDVEDFEDLYDTIFLCHSTHSSTKKEPRLRWIFPLTRPVTPDEYRQLANIVAVWVGVDTIDETTDQPERLMFWPSVSKDAEYYCATGGTEFLNPDEYLEQEDEPAPPAPKPKEPKQIQNGTLEIGEGQRNKAVFRFAAMLRGAGMDKDGIRPMIGDYNDRYCNPPLPDSELDTIVRSVCSRYEAGDPIGSLRDAWDDFADLGERKDRDPEPKQINELKDESFFDLGERDVPPPEYTVEGLITTGITILASPPKFGKSWMCMDLALSVATGTEFLGMETHRTGVVYLALEDGDYRLLDRGDKVTNGRGRPKNLYLVKEAPILKEGLLKQILALIDKKPEKVGMVIIDTLQKVRGVAGKTEGVYGYDYRELGQLHQFALDNGIAVVLVHHLNKGGDDADFVNRLNGSTGVSGAADTIITLTRAKRGDDMTKMSITGRDVTERTLVIQMDWHNYRWILLGDERDVKRDEEEHSFWNDPVTKTIVYNLDEIESLMDTTEGKDQVEWRCSSSDLLKYVENYCGPQRGESANSIGMKVKKLQPKLESLAGIGYSYERDKNKRMHVFTREII